MKARCNWFAIAVLLTGVRIASAQCYTFSSGSAASFTVNITSLPSPTMPSPGIYQYSGTGLAGTSSVKVGQTTYTSSGPISLIVAVSSDSTIDFSAFDLTVGKSAAFWKYHSPWARKPAVFYDPRGPEKTPDLPACQHAKCILVDGSTAFLTSANFTESAHERNIELGVLFRDNPRVAESIRSKFASLIQNGFLKRLPVH